MMEALQKDIAEVSQASKMSLVASKTEFPQDAMKLQDTSVAKKLQDTTTEKGLQDTAKLLQDVLKQSMTSQTQPQRPPSERKKWELPPIYKVDANNDLIDKGETANDVVNPKDESDKGTDPN